jgi:hypothetical protein
LAFLLAAPLCESQVIPLGSEKHHVFSLVSSLSLWLSQPDSMILLASVMRRRAPPVVVPKIRRADFFRH